MPRRFEEIIERHGPDAVAVYGSGQRRAPNNLTNRAIDPVSKQPELKFAAINLRALSREKRDCPDLLDHG
jgi:hypothetical protein